MKTLSTQERNGLLLGLYKTKVQNTKKIIQLIIIPSFLILFVISLRTVVIQKNIRIDAYNFTWIILVLIPFIFLWFQNIINLKFASIELYNNVIKMEIEKNINYEITFTADTIINALLRPYIWGGNQLFWLDELSIYDQDICIKIATQDDWKRKDIIVLFDKLTVIVDVYKMKVNEDFLNYREIRKKYFMADFQQ